MGAQVPGVDALADDDERQLDSARDFLLHFLGLENLLDGGNLGVVHFLDLTCADAVAGNNPTPVLKRGLCRNLSEVNQILQQPLKFLIVNTLCCAIV